MLQFSQKCLIFHLKVFLCCLLFSFEIVLFPCVSVYIFSNILVQRITPLLSQPMGLSIIPHTDQLLFSFLPDAVTRPKICLALPKEASLLKNIQICPHGINTMQ